MLNKIIVNDIQIIGSSVDGTVIVTAVRPGKRYVDGKATDEIDHYKYDVVLPNNGFEKITVKVKGNPLITKEQLAQKNGAIKVKFKGLAGRFYRNDAGIYILSASAESVEVVN